MICHMINEIISHVRRSLIVKVLCTHRHYLVREAKNTHCVAKYNMFCFFLIDFESFKFICKDVISQSFTTMTRRRRRASNAVQKHVLEIFFEPSHVGFSNPEYIRTSNLPRSCSSLRLPGVRFKRMKRGAGRSTPPPTTNGKSHGHDGFVVRRLRGSVTFFRTKHYRGPNAVFCSNDRTSPGPNCSLPLGPDNDGYSPPVV